MTSTSHSISTGIRCPACQGPLTPKVLACSICDLKVEGHFQGNEFASLSDDELHLLRIFVRTEGSIREMEASLGLSYPTIKSRLAELKKRLGLGGDASPQPAEDATADAASAPPTSTSKSANLNPATPEEALQMLQRGELSYEEALIQIKKLKSNMKTSAKAKPTKA